MNEGNASGELEGSTLGSSSREGDTASQEQRRTQSSGGFFLDSSSLPRAKSLHAGHHRRPRRDEPSASGKRGATEPDYALPKKKSRFPWGRHHHHHHQRHAVESPPPVASSSSDATTSSRRLPSANPSETQELPTSSSDRDDGSSTNRGMLGLDHDSAQIVNLALNLSESRKKGGGGAGISSPPTGVGGFGQHPFQAHGNLPRPFTGDRLRTQDSPRAWRQTSALSQLPGGVKTEDDNLPSHYSDATLRRAEKARLHFELSYQYLRLLRVLPPLQRPGSVSTSDSGASSAGSRAYNPLQCIRNRKIRFRERSAIDPETDGWNDIESVREWVDAVEDQYFHQGHGLADCMSMKPPSSHKGKQRSIQGEPEDVDMLPVSPPSSLRQVSHASGGIKVRRPRLDWIITPAELLADAAWVEEDSNKNKLVDKEGNKLYADASELSPVDGSSGSLDFRGRQRSSSRRSLSPDPRGSNRGRSRYRSRSPSRFSARSSNMSGRGRDPRRWATRSTASSSISPHDADEHHKRQPGERRTKWADQTANGNAQIPPLKYPGAIRVPPKGNWLTQESSGPSSYSKGHSHLAKTDQRAESVSSAPSIDGKHGSHIPSNAVESPSVGSPSRVGCFPSITVDLSPPASRSPSPTKKHLPRVIGTIRDRSRSKHRGRGARETANDELLASRNTSKQSAGTTPERSEHAPLLDPSRVQTHLSSSYGDGQRASDPQLVETSRGEKGPSHSDSKLRRGIHKGRGRIAEIVGNEVSRVGDFLKKDSTGHNRKPSSAPSLASDDSVPDEGEGAKPDLKSSLLRRFATSSDDGLPLDNPDLDKQASKGSIPNQTNVTPQRRIGQHERGEASDMYPPHERSAPSSVDLSRRATKKGTSAPIAPRDKFDSPTPLGKLPEGQTGVPSLPKPRRKDVKNAFFPASPPVTGLARAEATADLSFRNKRRSFADAPRAWSISDRSVSTSASLGLPGKSEIERTRALLLCSGIKAREITRRAEVVRYPPPDFLIQSRDDPAAPIPRVPRVNEHEYAARNLLRQCERSDMLLQQSMHRFSNAICPPLKSQLTSLENLIDQSLSVRVREASIDADNLNLQLSTTATLAVKQLGDILDRAARRRHRRLRLIRGASFFLLEWTLVTVMWVVWLIVMVFKAIRGVFRGAIGGVKWVLWI